MKPIPVRIDVAQIELNKQYSLPLKRINVSGKEIRKTPMPCAIPITSRIPSQLQLFAISTVVCILRTPSLLLCAMDSVSLGSAEEPYDLDMTHSYRLTEGRLIRYPL